MAVAYDYGPWQVNRVIPPVNVDAVTIPTGNAKVHVGNATGRVLAYVAIRYCGLRLPCRLAALPDRVALLMPRVGRGNDPIEYADSDIRFEFRRAAIHAYAQATGQVPRRLPLADEPATPSIAAVAASTEE